MYLLILFFCTFFLIAGKMIKSRKIGHDYFFFRSKKFCTNKSFHKNYHNSCFNHYIVMDINGEGTIKSKETNGNWLLLRSVVFSFNFQLTWFFDATNISSSPNRQSIYSNENLGDIQLFELLMIHIIVDGKCFFLRKLLHDNFINLRMKKTTKNKV